MRWSAFMIFMVVIGGIDTIEGPVLGAALFFEIAAPEPRAAPKRRTHDRALETDVLVIGSGPPVAAPRTVLAR